MPGGTRRSPADRSGLPVCSRTRRPSSGGSKGPRADYPPPAGAPDPLAADPPFHPSYEDRAGAPDRVFARVDDDAYERLVAAWIEHLRAAGADEADVLHLHHLTPLNEAAERAFPHVQRVGHVHGTEVLMLREIDDGPPAGWEYAGAWAERMRRWARACERVLVLSPDAVRRVPDRLGVGPGRVVWAPNGFDPAGLDPHPPPRAGGPRHPGGRAGGGGPRGGGG